MKALHTLSQNLKNSPYGDAGRMQILEMYRMQAQNLIRFAGALRLRLGADVYRQLSSLSECGVCVAGQIVGKGMC
jgi:nuclear pore complex protein Nup93